MEKAPQRIQPMLVLDTNVCLDLFVFHDPRWLPLLTGLRDNRLKAMTNKGCRDEWLAVLHYKHLPVTDENRPTIMSSFDQLIHFANPESSTKINLPMCSDPDDQKFMELARDGKATHLITKDKALLKCAKKVNNFGLFQIMPPEIFIKSVIF